MADVTIPQDMWEEDAEGFISSWFYADGDQVAAGDLIAEVMLEKTAFELFAAASGTLELLVAVEVPVSKGQLVARIGG